MVLLLACATPADVTAPESTPTETADAPWSWPEDTLRLCDAEPPPWAEPPPEPPAFTGGECPVLNPGTNVIRSSGSDRAFILVMPDEVAPEESLPLAILWHPLATDADVFLEQGELVAAINEQRFMALLPEDKGDLWAQWPWMAYDSDARIEEELVFLDDMLACAMEQLPVNRWCVSNGGVSSGGLWSDQVAWRRGQYFASQISISGGVGDGSLVRDWGGSPHKMPVLNLWGGEDDQCYVFEFTPLAQRLGDAVEADDHVVLECVHNCGHAVPPNDDPSRSQFAMFWDFMLAHPYWLEDGQTPWSEGLPDTAPDWCSLGNGSATTRVGVCEMENQCEGL